MNITTVAEGIYQLSVNVENILFEGLWEIPNGVSLNSYIIKGEKTAIVDGVCGWDGVPESLFALLDKMDINPESIEYLIVNHMEPDHSGWIENFKKINSNFKVVSTAKAAELLDGFYGHTDNIIMVKDDDTLDLGNGRVLTFKEIPNVHWPDTMATFDTLTGTLFSCDAFGAFGSVTDGNYDDLLKEEEIDFYENEAVRYYSNIVGAFSLQVKKAIEKCSQLPIKIIAPGHGIVWRKNPNKILEDYERYASYSKGPAKEEITIIWGSMYGMTEKAVRYVEKVLKEEGIKVNVHQVPEDSWGTVLASVWNSTGIILAMPTYEYKMFPPVAAVLEEIGKKKVLNRKVFRFGSYGWSGGAQKELDEIVTRLRMNWEFLEPVEFKGSASEEELELIGERAKDLVKEVRNAVNK
ncbi:flavorubredoxin [Natranaerovirga pectinivora]|uniref:Flavorubredoxin n=1 Tax=Natranaerovirga pectinivora TaxID=682400 RepID=A0A4V2V0N3_9FIRM|nr:FprA family A-type flavoprotein [Natranaerovirga pectinivora]TCT16999.1 flavorubredoxin [Natranaerovirga pectinivora]